MLFHSLCKVGIADLKKATYEETLIEVLRQDVRPKKMPLAKDLACGLKQVNFVLNNTKSLVNGTLINNSLGNQSTSNIIGYFDKPDRNIKENALAEKPHLSSASK